MKIKIIKIFALLAGFFLLVWIVRKIGLTDLRSGFHILGWRIFVPVFILFPSYLCYTVSWQLFLKRFDRHTAPFWRLFRIKVAGEASNMLTPLNFAGGDPIRIWLLSKNYPMDMGVASVVVDRTLHFGATVLVIMAGSLAAVFMLPLPLPFKHFLLAAVILLFIFMLLVLFHQTQGVFRKIFRFLEMVKIKKFSERTLEKIDGLDRHVREFYQRDRRIFFGCLLLHLISRLFLIVEIYVLARFLRVPMEPWEALFFSAVIPMVNLMSALIPGSLGVMEGAVSSLFAALHWNPTMGVILQIGRRFREFVWLLIGMGFLVQLRKKSRRINTASPALPPTD